MKQLAGMAVIDLAPRLGRIFCERITQEMGGSGGRFQIENGTQARRVHWAVATKSYCFISEDNQEMCSDKLHRAGMLPRQSSVLALVTRRMYSASVIFRIDFIRVAFVPLPYCRAE